MDTESIETINWFEAYMKVNSELQELKRLFTETVKPSQVKRLFQFTVYTQPLPKQRHRSGNGNTYTPEKTREYEETIGWRCCVEMSEWEVEQFTGDIMVRCVFGRKGKRRADADNMLKAVLDGLNGIVYADDKQIVELNAQVLYGCEQPYIIISIGAIDANHL